MSNAGKAIDSDDPDYTGLATVCLIVGFCVGLGLGVAALTTATAQTTPR